MSFHVYVFVSREMSVQQLTHEKKLNVVTYFKVKQQQQHFDEAEKCVRLAVCLASSLVWSNHTSHLSRLLLLHCSARSHHSTPRC